MDNILKESSTISGTRRRIYLSVVDAAVDVVPRYLNIPNIYLGKYTYALVVVAAGYVLCVDKITFSIKVYGEIVFNAVYMLRVLKIKFHEIKRLAYEICHLDKKLKPVL